MGKDEITAKAAKWGKDEITAKAAKWAKKNQSQRRKEAKIFYQGSIFVDLSTSSCTDQLIGIIKVSKDFYQGSIFVDLSTSSYTEILMLI